MMGANHRQWIGNANQIGFYIAATLLLLMTQLSYSKDVIVTNDSVSNFIWIYSSIPDATYTENQLAGIRIYKMFTSDAYPLLDVSTGGFVEIELPDKKIGFVRERDVRCVSMPTTSTPVYSNCKKVSLSSSSINNIYKVIKSLQPKLMKSLDTFNNLVSQNKRACSNYALLNQFCSAVDTPFFKSTAIVSIFIFIIGQVLIKRKEKRETKNAKAALISELRTNLVSLNQIFDNEQYLINNGEEGEAAKAVRRIERRMSSLLSIRIFQNLDNTHLRETKIIGTIIQLYTNILAFSSCGLKPDENQSKDISQATNFTSPEIRVFFFKMLILLLQCEFSVMLLQKKKLLEAEKSEDTLIKSLEYYHDRWDFSETKLKSVSDRKGIWSKLKNWFNLLLVTIHLGRWASIEDIDNNIFIIEKPEEVMNMLMNIHDRHSRDKYIQRYNWVRQTSF
ncbi:MAG: hypothetical protein MI976_28100 [Pseudomonadales bacterium]|nr:hypothetical protein [Pseudomonadales bacterium]